METERADAIRMYSHSRELSDSAELLAGHLEDHGTASVILKLIAFEVALKAALLVSSGKNAMDIRHHFKKGWYRLDTDIQSDVRRNAEQRMAGHVSFHDIDALLDTWESNFIAVRYSYEKLNGLSDEVVREKGDNWIKGGCQDEDADFVFHPDELFALTHGLHVWLSQKLKLCARDIR